MSLSKMELRSSSSRSPAAPTMSRRRGEGDGDLEGVEEIQPSIFLPPELKLLITAFMSTDDLKSLRLADRAWHSAATTTLYQSVSVKMTESFLKHVLGKKSNVNSIPFNSFKIEFDPPNSGGGFTFAKFREQVLLVLRTKVEGGGGAVKQLIFGFIKTSPKKLTAFLQDLFSTCPNVEEISVLDARLFEELKVLAPLPTLEQCKTVKWAAMEQQQDFQQSRVGAFLDATPNVEMLKTSNKSLLYALAMEDLNLNQNVEVEVHHRHWLKLNAVECECVQFIFGSGSNCVPLLCNLTRPLKTISLICSRDWYQGFLVAVMQPHNPTLEVLEFVLSDYGTFSPFQPPNPNQLPVMLKLHTISIVNIDADVKSHEDFIFGNWFYGGDHKPWWKTHCPALTTLKLTVRHNERTKQLGEPCIFLLTHFPSLFAKDGEASPNITTLDLPWPHPADDLDLWKAWTRRIVSKFPNVQGNPHINKWKELKLDEDEDDDGGPDRLAIECENLQRRFEAMNETP